MATKTLTKTEAQRIQFFGSVRDELKKVTWPSRQETIRLTIVVIAISLIIAFYIGIIDLLLAKALEILTKH